jgi:DNA invertase Pin-like site-specific DNA recombinase
MLPAGPQQPRNNADWHRLLQLCAFNATLICDEDGLYDPCTINDRLLLGLKGAMSEALRRHRRKASYADLLIMPTRHRSSLCGWGFTTARSA